MTLKMHRDPGLELWRLQPWHFVFVISEEIVAGFKKQNVLCTAKEVHVWDNYIHLSRLLRCQVYRGECIPLYPQLYLCGRIYCTPESARMGILYPSSDEL